MKILSVLLLSLGICNSSFGQDSLLRVSELKILELDERLENFKQNMADLGQMLDQNELQGKVAIQFLKERVKGLDSIQKAIEERELEIYKDNYEVAIMQLKSLQKLTSGFELFDNTAKFFGDIKGMSNPLKYSKYDDWNKNFKAFIERNKSMGSSANVLLQFMNKDSTSVGNLLSNIPYMSLLTQGITLFINSKKKHDAFFQQSQEILRLNVKLSTFEQEINRINNKDAYDLKQQNFKKHYYQILNDNLQCLGENMEVFEKKHVRAMDEIHYEDQLREKARAYVGSLKLRDSKNWKTEINHSLLRVQKVNTDFNDIMVNVYAELKKYDEILQRYRTDSDINVHLKAADHSLERLITSFATHFFGSNESTIPIALFKTP